MGILLFQLNLAEASEPEADVPPADLVAVLNGDGTATLTWTDTVSDNTGYAVERSDDGGAFAEIAADAGDVETYDDTGPLTEGTRYRYRLVVVGGALDGQFSNTYTVGGGGGGVYVWTPRGRRRRW